MSSTRTVLNNSTGLQVRKSNKFTAVFVSRARSRLVLNQKGTEHSGQRSPQSSFTFSLKRDGDESSGADEAPVGGSAGLSARPQARTHSSTPTPTRSHTTSLVYSHTHANHARSTHLGDIGPLGPGSTHTPHTHTRTQRFDVALVQRLLKTV